MASTCGAVAIVASLAAPLEARANKFDETLEFSIHTRASALDFGGLGLRRTRESPALLSDAWLPGRAHALAPMLRANLSLDGWRFGAGADFEGYRGGRLAYAPTRPASVVTDARVWGLPIEGFVGYAFRSDARVRPFIEGRTTLTFLQAQARVQARIDPHGEGETATVRMRATSFGVAARAGVLVQINEYFFFDAGVGRVLHGAGAWTACVGIGIPIPLSNL